MWSSLMKPGVFAQSSKSMLRCLAVHTSAPVSESYQVPVSRQREWNRTVAAAEKLVGFPTSIFHLQSLMSDDVTSMATHLRKLMTSDHPILKTIKRLIHHEGKTNAQVRGLIILLLARATATTEMRQMHDFDPKSGVLGRQRQLAEIIEMIQSAQAIHKSVLNLPLKISNDNKNLQDDLEELEYGNKLAILGGDYLLANACTGLASLRNTYISEMIAICIAEFAQSEFLGKRDIQGRFIPDGPEHLTVNGWLQRTHLGHGSLMGKGCKSSGLLGGLQEEACVLLQRIGTNISLGLQAFTELEPFLDSSIVSHGQTFELSAAPVLFHLRSDPALFAYIKNCEENNIDNLDHVKIYNAVINGPGIVEAQTLCKNLSTDCMQYVAKLPESDAKEELERLVTYLQN